jgi:hypothetical protein
MRAFFDSASWVLSSCLVVVLCIIISLWALWKVRKAFSVRELKKSHDVVGFTFGILGVLYSVILGFTVINAQDRYNTVLETIHTEAILLADLYQDAAYFAAEDRDAIRLSLRQYIDHVVKEEWWIKAKQINPRSRDFIKNIWDSYYRVALHSEKEKIWYSESIAKLNNFMNARLARQFTAWEHLGAMMWTLLIIGAVIVICFMFFFGLENMRSHMILTALLVGYLSFMLFLVYTLDHIFTGPQALKPTALEQVYNLFDEWDADAMSFSEKS